jgi:hypothetical protein
MPCGAGTSVPADTSLRTTERSGWDRGGTRTVRVARAIYLRLPEDAQFWLRGKDFVEPHPDAIGAALTIERGETRQRLRDSPDPLRSCLVGEIRKVHSWMDREGQGRWKRYDAPTNASGPHVSRSAQQTHWSSAARTLARDTDRARLRAASVAAFDTQAPGVAATRPRWRHSGPSRRPRSVD